MVVNLGRNHRRPRKGPELGLPLCRHRFHWVRIHYWSCCLVVGDSRLRVLLDLLRKSCWEAGVQRSCWEVEVLRNCWAAGAPKSGCWAAVAPKSDCWAVGAPRSGCWEVGALKNDCWEVASPKSDCWVAVAPKSGCWAVAEFRWNSSCWMTWDSVRVVKLNN